MLRRQKHIFSHGTTPFACTQRQDLATMITTGACENRSHLNSGSDRISETKNQPKEEVFGRTSLQTSGQKLRSGCPNPGKKNKHLARTVRADAHEKTLV